MVFSHAFSRKQKRTQSSAGLDTRDFIVTEKHNLAAIKNVAHYLTLEAQLSKMFCNNKLWKALKQFVMLSRKRETKLKEVVSVQTWI